VPNPSGTQDSGERERPSALAPSVSLPLAPAPSSIAKPGKKETEEPCRGIDSSHDFDG